RVIAAELPLGTHRDAIEKWITARGYDQRFSKDMMQNSRRIASCVHARVPKAYFWYGKGEIELYFWLDDKGRLVESLIRWIGPPSLGADEEMGHRTVPCCLRCLVPKLCLGTPGREALLRVTIPSYYK